MVFTKLSVQEKDAFFGLLDEYFQSRPELFGQNDGQGTGISTVAAASAVQRALAANAIGASGASGKSSNPFTGALTTSNLKDVDAAQAVTVGRVAAASLAFSQGQGAARGGHGSGASPSPTPTPMSTLSGLASAMRPQTDGAPSLPHRVTSNVPAPASANTEQIPGSEVDKLVTRKASVFSSFKKQPSAGVVIPPAFVAPKNTYGPPPVRRVMSETSTSAGSGTTPRQPEPQPEEAFAEGEWAEVLYDYKSEDPGDLAIEAGARVFVTAKSSEDWWTGQVEGQDREGLFPASYVKLL